MSIGGWVDKQNTYNPHSGIVLSHKKEWISNAHYNVQES
jgi:hypothetical protein